MATQKVRPDPGALERQLGQQRRRTIRRKMGVYGLVAALAVVTAVVVVREGFGSSEPVPAGQPSGSTTAPATTGPVGTVTFDGSTCSMEITADQIETGVVVFEAVNASEHRAMFDSWQLLDGYTFQAFEATVERWPANIKAGTPGQRWPGEKKVTYLGSDVIPANSSGTIVATMSAGRHAITCLQPVEGGTGGLRPSGIAGPIVVR